MDASPSPSAHTQAGVGLLEDVSKEMRAPLNHMLAMAGLLQRQSLTAEGRAQVDVLIDSATALSGMLANAVDLCRAESGGLVLARERVGLRDMVDEIQLQGLARAAENGLGLSVAYTGAIDIAADLDPARLRQVYGALIGAALKSTVRGAVEAGLEARRQGARVLLKGYVRDTGPSLPPNLRAPQGWEALEARGGGLDLAVSHRTLEAMGARVWAENNKGAGVVLRFEFEAPASRPAAATPEEAEAAAARTALRGHVLVVDDNATNRMVARTLVEMFGCTAETVGDGVEAVEAVSRRAYDLVLMDIRMPRLDGVGAALAIRALPGPESGTPIVALTANADPEDVKRYLAAGMASVVEKPIKADRLLSALAEALAAQPGRAAVAA